MFYHLFKPPERIKLVYTLIKPNPGTNRSPEIVFPYALLLRLRSSKSRVTAILARWTAEMCPLDISSVNDSISLSATSAARCHQCRWFAHSKEIPLCLEYVIWIIIQSVCENVILFFSKLVTTSFYIIGERWGGSTRRGESTTTLKPYSLYITLNSFRFWHNISLINCFMFTLKQFATIKQFTIKNN